MKLVLIGSGNTATVIGTALAQAGHQILAVAGTNRRTVSQLARKVKGDAIYKLNEVPLNAAIYLLAVNDDQIEQAAAQLPLTSGIVAHTSGSVDLKTLRRHKKRGVFYPLDTLRKERSRFHPEIPVCVEGSDTAVVRTLRKLAGSISERVVTLPSSKRVWLHLAAVITNNFSNHLFAQSNKLLQKQGIPTNLLHTLMYSTVANALVAGPALSQTGPAARGDRKTIARHLNMLKSNKRLQKVYQIISDDISHAAKKS